MKASLIELVWERAGQKCEYCRFPIEYAWLPFQVDHINAEKHGGALTDSNLALSCYYCNSFKGPNIAGIDPFGDPDTAIQLSHPRKDDWASNLKMDWAGTCRSHAQGTCYHCGASNQRARCNFL